MINYTATFNGYYRTVANATTHATNAVGAAFNGCKRGFLSCLARVYNSLISMKKAIAGGISCLRQKLRPSQVSSEATERAPMPAKIEVLPISAELTREVCQAIRQQMEIDPNYLNGMFRLKPAETDAELNELLKQPEELLVRICDKRLSSIALGYLVKQWIASTLDGNKFTAAERRLLMENIGHPEVVNKIINDKFPEDNPDNRTKKDKFTSLLSVMGKYDEVCAVNRETEKREYGLEVMAICCVPSLFEVDWPTENLQHKLTVTDWSIESFKQDIAEGKLVLIALLKHAPPPTPPKPATARDNSLKQQPSHNG